MALTGVTATAGSGQATVNFTAPAGATSVKVQYSTDGTTWTNSTTALTATSTTATVTGLTNGTEYQFRVVVVGGLYEGTSNVVTATPAAAAAPTLTGVTLTDALGLANNGKSTANLPTAGSGNTFKYLISSDGNAVPTPNVGDDVNTWTTVANSDAITVTNGTNVGVAEVDANDKVVKFVNVVAANADYIAAEAATATSLQVTGFDFSTDNREFSISDGTNTATVSLTTDVTDIDGLVTAINTAITNGNPNAVAVTATAEGADKVKLTADNTTITITIGGANASSFISGTTFAPTPEQN